MDISSNSVHYQEALRRCSCTRIVPILSMASSLSCTTPAQTVPQSIQVTIITCMQYSWGLSYSHLCLLFPMHSLSPRAACAVSWQTFQSLRQMQNGRWSGTEGESYGGKIHLYEYPLYWSISLNVEGKSNSMTAWQLILSSTIHKLSPQFASGTPPCSFSASSLHGSVSDYFVGYIFKVIIGFKPATAIYIPQWTTFLIIIGTLM